jgi:type II secretory ATPase GspE/PulE/Tfp pilus assembly ATPase PilB-like protein
VKGRTLLRAGAAAGLLGPEEVEALTHEARRARRDPVELATARLRLPAEAFYRALARERGLAFVESTELCADPEVVASVPAALLIRKRVLPLRRRGASVQVAVTDPDDGPTHESLARRLAAPLELVLAEPAALELAIRRATRGGEATTFEAVQFLDALLRQAYLRRASDVHLDPQSEGLVIRLRVDGRLRMQGPALTPQDAAPLVSRLKVLAGLDIAERRQPQDGGFRHDLGELGSVDVRAATIPTRHGERVTLRLLGVETRALTLERLGFAPAQEARFRDVLTSPHGLVLLAGPTGSGKSTTLYAALRALRDPELNLMTVEDPVEFLLEGVTQTQVDRAGKVTFAGALRSILRHDPDVIMVGEVRDRETADVALKSALTGHLVLSSLHANRAVGAVTRLSDLGCERSLLAACLRAVLAQRLVRRLCACASKRLAPAADLAPLGGEGSASVREPLGCPACVGTGYRGRLALTEALWVDATLERAIAGGAHESELCELALAAGGTTLASDGLRQVLEGATSLREALRARC